MGSVQQLRGEWNSLHSRQQQISDLFEGLLAKKNHQLTSRTVKLQPPQDHVKPRTSIGTGRNSPQTQKRLDTLTRSHDKLSQTLAAAKVVHAPNASASPAPPRKPAPATTAAPSASLLVHTQAAVAVVAKVAGTREQEVLTDPTPQLTQISQTEQPHTQHAESQTTHNKVTVVATQTTVVAEEERRKEEANNKRKLHEVVDNVDELFLHLISSFKKVCEYSTHTHTHTHALALTLHHTYRN